MPRVHRACLVGTEFQLDVLDDAVPLDAREPAGCLQDVAVQQLHIDGAHRSVTCLQPLPRGWRMLGSCRSTAGRLLRSLLRFGSTPLGCVVALLERLHLCGSSAVIGSLGQSGRSLGHTSVLQPRWQRNTESEAGCHTHSHWNQAHIIPLCAHGTLLLYSISFAKAGAIDVCVRS